MQSSSGRYRPSLDQMRGVASYLVFCWHFVHVDDVLSVRGGDAAIWPLSMISMGYIGVAMFMVLSGYLFAALTMDRQVHWPTFMRNRVLRLAPLLVFALSLALLKSHLKGEDLGLGERLLWGWLLPVLPQGAWSITVECHFYALLPLLLWLGRGRPWAWAALIVAAMALRGALHARGAPIDYLSSLTIVGRIDQFLAGMLMWQFKDALRGRWIIPAVAFLGFSAFMSYIDHVGAPSEPGLHPLALWVILPTIEAIGFALLIGWWDVRRDGGQPGLVGRFWALSGRVSYSMYLLHTFWVFQVARWCHERLHAHWAPESAIALATLLFAMSVPVAMLSHRFVEVPFLLLRKAYVTPRPQLVHQAAAPDRVALPLKDAA